MTVPYFSLLNVLLSIYSESDATQSWLNALHTALGFECFGVTSSASDSEALGASTCTIRNLCYLLAKLKMPDVLDDPQFLPIITVAGAKKPELFHHYRQYPLSLDSLASLMFYPAVSEDKRSASFKLINSLVGGVSYGVDPRTRERAKRLYQKIIRPILETDNLTDSGSLWLELVDVGAGSGGLTSAICRQIHDMGFKLKFRLWFVDSEPADPARFFGDKKSKGVVDSLLYLGDDYRSWLSREKPLPATNCLRIALVSRLFNNLSRFSIYRLNGSDLSSLFEKMAISPDSPVRSFNPECLVTSGGGSVISCLVENCDYVVIEDADLRPQDLVEHMKTFSLHSATIQDMTKALGLTGNHTYIIWLKSKPKEYPNFGGEWIW